MRFVALLLVFLLAPLSARAVDIESVTSPGGITAWLIEDHSNPLISLSFGFKGGASEVPAGKEGLATFVSGLLDEGAGDIVSADFQKTLADHGIDFGFDASLDSFSGGLRFLADDKDLAANLLGVALAKPRFDTEPVSRMRGQFVASAEDAQKDPEQVAQQTFGTLLFAGGFTYLNLGEVKNQGIELGIDASLTGTTSAYDDPQISRSSSTTRANSSRVARSR